MNECFTSEQHSLKLLAQSIDDPKKQSEALATFW